MLRLKTLLIVLHFTLFASSQIQVRKFVKQTAVPILTINPDSTNFTDLEVIGKSIGDSKIVMLGEQDHGDAPTFLAKTRIIKYLHEKKGFNVVAFESDFFGLNYGWDNLKKEKGGLDSFIQNNIYPIWTHCNTCRHLFYEYIPNSYSTENPIAITGFDNQLILAYSFTNLASKLDSVLRSLELAIVKDNSYITDILPTIDSLKYLYSAKAENAIFHLKCGTYLEEIKRQLGEKLRNNDFWMMIVNNLIAENSEFQTRDYQARNNARDAQMAQNLQWLMKVKYPKEKIIVWAANAHVAKYYDVSKNYPYKELIAMGSYFTRDSLLLKQSYIIGFTSFEGEAGRLGADKYKIRQPMANGFETWMDKSYNYAFVNFKDFKEESKPFYLKGLGHNSFFKKDWTTIFDGIFFIRTMYPCER